jgi:hypothetical protein
MKKQKRESYKNGERSDFFGDKNIAAKIFQEVPSLFSMCLPMVDPQKIFK